MISDEQRKAFEQWYKSLFGADVDMLRDVYNPDMYHFIIHQVAWVAWKTAQEVKPLNFVSIDNATKKADTAFGQYFICAYVDEVCMALPEETNYFGSGYKTEAEAIEAANIDNRRRVLSCLVNGGV